MAALVLQLSSRRLEQMRLNEIKGAMIHDSLLLSSVWLLVQKYLGATRRVR